MGCGSGAPNGCCIVTGGWRGGAAGTEDGTEGINSADAGEKNEGFIRFVGRLLLPLLDS